MKRRGRLGGLSFDLGQRALALVLLLLPAACGSSAAGDPDAGDPDTGPVDSGPRVLAPWASLEFYMTGAARRTIAVDRDERVFVTDGATVFQLDAAGTPTPYLTSDDLSAAIGATPAVAPDIAALDVDDQGALYLLHAGDQQRVLVASAAHAVTTWRTLDPTITVKPRALGVISPDLLLTFGGSVLQKLTKTSVNRVNGTTFGGADPCGSESFTTLPDGFFFYSPGCWASDLKAGKATSVGAAVILPQKTVADALGNSAFEFSGLARDPAGGGAFVVTERALLRVAEDGTWEVVPTSPTIVDLAPQVSPMFGMKYASVAAGPSGTLYVLAPFDKVVLRARFR